MGAVVSAVSRRIQRFNFENRVHREISKEKPSPAPAYRSTIKGIQRAKDSRQAIEEQNRKHLGLHERLKVVFLKSLGVDPEKNLNSGKNLPVNRNTPGETDFGFQEPKMVPRGKVTLGQALKFIVEHQLDPRVASISQIAYQHYISETTAANILKYFRPFQIYIPDRRGQLGGLQTTIKQISQGKPDEKQ